MKTLSKQEQDIYNEGERLIPGVTHNVDEFIRHRSSYKFFYDILSHDKNTLGKENDNVCTIIDLGSGVGHGCHFLAKLPNSQVTGVDISLESLSYANANYSSENIRYKHQELTSFVPEMSSFDYVVSRGSLEHVPNGLEVARTSKWTQRLIIDVPYKEEEGNPHHLLHQISEESFSAYDNPEFFYQDLNGWIYDEHCKPEKPNGIICVCSSKKLKRVSEIIKFPYYPYNPDEKWLHEHGRSNMTWVKRTEFLDRAKEKILHTDSVLDIGCGLKPQTFFRPKLRIFCEAHDEYANILKDWFDQDPETMIVHSEAEKFLPHVPDKSIDSVMLLDFLEHVDKINGQELIKQSERIARKQIIVFTPLGFMPQEYRNDSDLDFWGLHGTHWQKHRSGWLPEDFDDSWDIISCWDYFWFNDKNEKQDPPVGAMFAVKNISNCGTICNTKADSFRLGIVSGDLLLDIGPESKIFKSILSKIPKDNYCFISRIEKSSTYDPFQLIEKNGLLPPKSTSDTSGIKHSLLSAPEPDVFSNKNLRIAFSWFNHFVKIRTRAALNCQYLKENRCTAVLASNLDPYDLPAGALAAKQLNLPFYAFVVNETHLKPTIRPGKLSLRFSHIKALKAAKAVFAADRSLAQRLTNHYRIPCPFQDNNSEWQCVLDHALKQ